MVYVSDMENEVTYKPEDFLRWRGRVKMTRREAAEALGISERAVGRYENGERPINHVTAMACAAVAAKLRPWRW